MYNYAYIDESGDTGKTKKSTKNFILCCVLVEDKKHLDRLARKVFKTKLKKKKDVNMLHAHRDTESVHKSILKNLKNINYRVVYIEDKDYLNGLFSLMQHISIYNVSEIFLAKRDSRKKTLEKIDTFSKKLNIKVIKTSPQNEKGLQIADFISWSIFRYEEFSDSIYFNSLENIEKIKPKSGL